MNVDAQPYGKTLGLRCSSLTLQGKYMLCDCYGLGTYERVLGSLNGEVYVRLFPFVFPVGNRGGCWCDITLQQQEQRTTGHLIAHATYSY